MLQNKARDHNATIIIVQGVLHLKSNYYPVELHNFWDEKTQENLLDKSNTRPRGGNRGHDHTKLYEFLDCYSMFIC